MAVKTYKDLIVWQKAMDLVAETYKIVRLLPQEEKYALSDQMRRAVISIPSNIAEGQRRTTTKDFLHFLSIARGSLGELDTQIEACARIGYCTEEDIANALELCARIGQLLSKLMQSLKGNNS